jgi:hypothetical protein
MGSGVRFGGVVLGLTFLFGVGVSAQASGRRPQVVIEVADFKPGQAVEPIFRSKIDFLDGGRTQKIWVADLSIPDAVTACPVDTMPADLDAMVSQLTGRVSALISKIKDDHGERCSALRSHLQAAQTQIGSAYQYQMVAASSIPSNANQDMINQETQKAGAISQLVMTTSDVLQNCMTKTSLTDQQVIQKLISQIVTLSGLFMGGWQGIALATGGQVIGALPLFTGDLDTALNQFKYYNEMNERGSFLCYLRQIRKTSCLLFASEEDQLINGLDLSFKAGPVRTTIETLDQFKKDDPQLVEDLEMIRRIKLNSANFMNAFTRAESEASRVAALPLSALMKPSVDELTTLCQSIQPFRVLAEESKLTDPSIRARVNEVESVCSREIKTVSFSLTRLSEVYWHLYVITVYYQSLIADEASPVGKVARTIESMMYFEELKKSVLQYSDSNVGNQSRMHFLDLSRKLSRAMGVHTFKTLFRDDYEKFSIPGNPLRLKQLRETGKCRSEHNDVRSRALRAMIDLCMTFDPTLACMEIGNPKKDPLFKIWLSHCVGPKSKLCKEPLACRERSTFLKDDQYRNYFDSLCGPEEKVVTDTQPPAGVHVF